MANYKLILEDELRDEFSLVAIYCSVEPYKMAYLINEHLRLKLRRKRVDLDFSKNGLEITFPWFEFEDDSNYISYDLLANKCRTERARTIASGGLFGDMASAEVISEFLIPELRKVDYLLKITSEEEKFPVRKLLFQLNEINEIISAHQVDPDELKSKNNLIFD